MDILSAAAVMAALVAGCAGGVALCRAAVRRRELAQHELASRLAHLVPRHAWPVAYASGPHMDSVFKLWTWEDVGVLHLYDEGLAYFGERISFELERDAIARVDITSYFRTNPLIPWLELETDAGARHLFCSPKGLVVAGMRERIEEIHAQVESWSRGGTSRPLQIE